MKNKLVLASILATLTGTTPLALAAGLKVNEQGGKAMGMGNAFAAQADDPSALFYNPAGIAFLKGAQVSLGSTIIYVSPTEFNGTTPLSGNAPLAVGSDSVFEKSKRDIFIAPALYATYSFESVPLSLGLAVNAIYPLAKSWDDSSAFRNQIMNIAVKPINFQPTVAYRFDDLNLSVGAGLDVTYAIVIMQTSAHSPVVDPNNPAPPFGAYELGNMGLDATATDIGYNLGLLWKPRKELSFGVAYRSEISLKLEGDANFLATTPTGLGAIGFPASAVFPYSRSRATSAVSSTVTLPESLALGAAWMPTDRLTLEFDAERTGWSSLKSLEFKFDSPQFKNFNGKPKPLEWKDVWAFKVGGQYALTKNLDLRAGYMYDTNPIPDSTLGPLLPDSDRHSFSIGQGIHNDMVALDLAYMWTRFVDRTVSSQNSATLLGENGTFKSDVHLFGGSITVKF